MDMLVPAACPLVRRFAVAEDGGFIGGDAAAEVLLDIRGILVGVSFARDEAVYASSRCSFELLAAILTTDGDPAMVGK